jgi:hypothetical protein
VRNARVAAHVRLSHGRQRHPRLVYLFCDMENH